MKHLLKSTAAWACALLLLPAARAADLPPCKIGDVTRAGVLNYDARIMEYNAAKGMYRVRYVTGYPGDEEWLPARQLKNCTGLVASGVPVSFFAARWELFTGGGGAYQKQKSGDWHVKSLDAAKAPPLTIKTDGHYTWVIDVRTTVSGNWRGALPAERKSGYEKLGTTLILLNGEDGKNWLVSRDMTGTSGGRDRILIERTDLGLTYRGSRVK